MNSKDYWKKQYEKATLANSKDWITAKKLIEQFNEERDPRRHTNASLRALFLARMRALELTKHNTNND